jgi:hypothetical protein
MRTSITWRYENTKMTRRTTMAMVIGSATEMLRAGAPIAGWPDVSRSTVR